MIERAQSGKQRRRLRTLLGQKAPAKRCPTGHMVRSCRPGLVPVARPRAGPEMVPARAGDITIDGDPLVASSSPLRPAQVSPMDSSSRVRRSPRRGMFSCRLTLLVLSLPLASACFSYTEVGVAVVSPGDPVRIRVFDEAVDRLPAELERATQVEGMVVDVEDSRLNLLPELGSVSTDPVSLALSDIQTISRRELSATRTWIAVGVGVALGAGMLLTIEGEPAGPDGSPPITGFMLGGSLPLGR